MASHTQALDLIIPFSFLNALDRVTAPRYIPTDGEPSSHIAYCNLLI